MTITAPPLRWVDATHVDYDGKHLVYMAGCDYYRLSWNPKVRKALRHTLQHEGLNTAASRITTGNHRIYDDLEKEIARYFAVESAVLASSGYAAVLMAGQALAGEPVQAWIDARAHSCLKDGCRLAGMPIRQYPHLSEIGLRRKLQRSRRKLRHLLVTDALFAHNGTVPPLKEYRKSLPTNAWILLDEAHSAGILGRSGRGLLEALNLSGRGVIRTVTLSKAFGVYGGAILCSHRWKKRITQSSHYYSGNTPLPLPLAAAAKVAVNLLQEKNSLREGLRSNIRFLRDQLGLKKPDKGSAEVNLLTPIFSIQSPSEKQRVVIRNRLMKAGIFPSFIRYPSGTRRGFYRFALSSSHTQDQLARLADVLKDFKLDQD